MKPRISVITLGVADLSGRCVSTATDLDWRPTASSARNSSMAQSPSSICRPG